MQLSRLFRSFVLILLCLTPCSLIAAAGDVESYTANVSGGTGQIVAAAEQGNGLVIIGGDFSQVGGLARNRIARLNTSGTVDPSFDPNIDGAVNCIAVQPDGKILVGGNFGSVKPNGGATALRSSLARFNADGSIDNAFDPGVAGTVRALAIQSNGSIVIAGNFTTVAGTARNHIARVSNNGTIDTAFNPDANGTVHAVLVQPDGKVVLGGEFTTVSATTRNRIARVESTGTLDTGFNPNANDTVWCLAHQPDGRILLGGKFTTVAATTRNRIARVDSTGALDTSFNPNADNDVYTIVRQADGKILFGGLFLTLQPPGAATPVNQRHIARFSSAGAIESTFNPVVGTPTYSAYVSSLTLQNDGKILLGGRFDYLDGATNGGLYTNHFGRLANDTTTDSITVPSASQVTWTRGGAAPELTHVILESSTNLATWSQLGTMTRVSTSANWQATGLSLPSTGYVRARAQACAGFGGGSQSLVEKVISFGGLATSNAVVSGNGRIISRSDLTPSTLDHTDFGSVPMATTDSITRTFTIQNTGSATLTLGSVSAQIYAFNGSYPSGFGYDGAFAVTAQPASSVAPGGVTTFTIRFNPSGMRQIGQLDYQVYFETNDPILGFGFNIRGTGLNTVPTVANPIPDQSINLGSAFNYTIPYATFSDADRNFDSFGFPSPSYSATPLPAGVILNSSSGAFSGTPTAAGSTNITVTYTDSQNATVSDTFTLTVIAPNSAPTVANPITDQNATEDTLFSYTFPANTFADADAGNVFTYSTTGLPAWLSFDPASRSFTGTPGDANVGFVDIMVTATDNGTPSTASVSDTFRITVTGVNDVPFFTKGANQSRVAGTNTTQTIVGWATGISDGDSHASQALTFLITSNTNPGLFTVAPAIASNGTLTYRPTGAGGTATIGVALQDDATAGGAALTSATQTFTITLTDTTGPSGGTMTLAQGSMVDAGQSLTVSFAGWVDPTGPLSYTVLVNNVVVSAAGSSVSRGITAPSTPGTYTLKGRILDALGNTTEVSQSFTVFTALESWRKSRFGSHENTGDSADDFDFDKDGVANLVESAFGMNPKASDNHLLPRPQRNGGNWVMEYAVPPGVSGVIYGAQWSETLKPGSWQGISNTGTTAQPVFSVPVTGRDRLFMRHVITKP